MRESSSSLRSSPSFLSFGGVGSHRSWELSSFHYFLFALQIDPLLYLYLPVLLGIHVTSHFPCFLPLAIPASLFTSHLHMHTLDLLVFRCGASRPSAEMTLHCRDTSTAFFILFPFLCSYSSFFSSGSWTAWHSSSTSLPMSSKI
ncbi:hypothetical protein DFH08DRAFT_883671 [Mycena albidolilacea]|uniref:Uncharacterized protein n=1 Tax=Mycena albidolilacea TaxID=1033008 RepID=A0AAD6ZLC6_9AGAR|nr:hypothetical protein DFH08DRAFT_883671 [Mycena albidolilacea]